MFQRSCGQLLHNKKSPHDIKLIPTWKTFNVYGRGVKVIVVDDGVFNHLDLEKNFVSTILTSFHSKNQVQ